MKMIEQESESSTWSGLHNTRIQAAQCEHKDMKNLALLDSDSNISILNNKSVVRNIMCNKQALT